MNFSAPRGTKDILPPETKVWQKIEAKFMEICRRYDYGEIRLPTFESTEVYQRGVGDASDIVQKEMYTFLDKSNRSLTLRPEGTAGLVRAFVENGMSSQAFPVKLYYMLNFFRYERVAKGRSREFRQLGLEALGSNSPRMDVEIIALLYDFISELGLKHIKLKINSIGNKASREAFGEALRRHLEPSISSMCADCQKRFLKNPMRILDCKIDECRSKLENMPVITDYLDEECQRHHDEVCEGLRNLNIPFSVDPLIVRGLDYYTKTVFELVSENVGSQGTICGGGRYDYLVEELGGPSVPACGFALGMERLNLELQAQNITLYEEDKPDLFIASLDEASYKQAASIAHKLRKQGLAVHTDLLNRGLKAQLKFANKKAYRFLLVLGEDELLNKKARLKPFASDISANDEGEYLEDDLILDFSSDAITCKALFK